MCYQYYRIDDGLSSRCWVMFVFFMCFNFQVLLPPQIEAVTKMLRVSVYDCLDMPRMDMDIGFVGMSK